MPCGVFVIKKEGFDKNRIELPCQYFAEKIKKFRSLNVFANGRDIDMNKVFELIEKYCTKHVVMSIVSWDRILRGVHDLGDLKGVGQFHIFESKTIFEERKHKTVYRVTEDKAGLCDTCPLNLWGDENKGLPPCVMPFEYTRLLPLLRKKGILPLEKIDELLTELDETLLINKDNLGELLPLAQKIEKWLSLLKKIQGKGYVFVNICMPETITITADQMEAKKYVGQ